MNSDPNQLSVVYIVCGLCLLVANLQLRLSPRAVAHHEPIPAHLHA